VVIQAFQIREGHPLYFLVAKPARAVLKIVHFVATPAQEVLQQKLLLLPILCVDNALRAVSSLIPGRAQRV